MKRILPAALLLCPTAALAHPGHGAGFLAGIAHPLKGIENLLTMLAIGLRAGSLGGRARLRLTFIAQTGRVAQPPQRIAALSGMAVAVAG